MLILIIILLLALYMTTMFGRKVEGDRLVASARACSIGCAFAEIAMWYCAGKGTYPPSYRPPASPDDVAVLAMLALRYPESFRVNDGDYTTGGGLDDYGCMCCGNTDGCCVRCDSQPWHDDSPMWDRPCHCESCGDDQRRERGHEECPIFLAF